jgi:hypothetical protein
LFFQYLADRPLTHLSRGVVSPVKSIVFIYKRSTHPCSKVCEMTLKNSGIHIGNTTASSRRRLASAKSAISAQWTFGSFCTISLSENQQCFSIDHDLMKGKWVQLTQHVNQVFVIARSIESLFLILFFDNFLVFVFFWLGLLSFRWCRFARPTSFVIFVGSGETRF